MSNTQELREAILKFDLRRAKSTRNFIKGLITEAEADASLDDDLNELVELIHEREREAREIYIPVRGYEGTYEVSNLGNVRRVNGKVLKAVRRGVRNYVCVTLSRFNKQVVFNVHRLVAEAFLSNPEYKETVNHKDGDQTNNNVENLEWATYSENERHARANGKVVWNKGRMGIPANKPRSIQATKPESKEWWCVECKVFTNPSTHEHVIQLRDFQATKPEKEEV